MEADLNNSEKGAEYVSFIGRNLEGSSERRNGGRIRLPGTLDENRLGHRDLGMNQWHSDAQDAAMQDLTRRAYCHPVYQKLYV